jgi:predicted CXXCH cytochrome family protein
MIPLLALALTASVGLWVTWVSWRTPQRVSRHRSDPISPYKNTRPGVKYVGDTTCARCHAEIAKTFRQHPMGRSLYPVATASATGGDDGDDRPEFSAQGFQYSVDHRGGRVIHKETRRDAQGRIIAQNEAEVQFVLGSGRQGLAFLMDRDGFLFESPITWYSRERRWDLSPGYEARNAHFDRPIQPDCLFCHANRVEPVEGTINRYQRPIFRGHAVGCERCHGPGELHVARSGIVDGNDPTIVNPGHLEPSLREAVCEQCHLLGEQRVVRAGRRNEDYRPGLPFHRFWTVFVEPESPAKNQFVGQVEQMHQSRCFLESRGRLGCISCHDPHQWPAPEVKVASYRDRCLECHAERVCSLPRDVRLTRSRDDDCAGCHMPRLGSSNNRHVATANHRIPRQADEKDQPLIGPGNLRAGARPWVPFHEERMDALERTEAERDLGVALCRAGPEGAEVARPLLEAALAARPDDVTAWEAKGLALGQLGRAEEGLAAFRTALAQAPTRESTLARAASLAAEVGRREEAIDYWRRAIDLNPWLSYYRAELALQYALDRNWRPAAEACRQTLQLNPANVAVRDLLIQCYGHLGDLQAARREFETLLGFDPPGRDALVRRFAQQFGLRGPPASSPVAPR